ncbi:MAG: GIY-YIG nuclease family protein [archaeon]|nr:GIY-YIG nuclease family protein [archaeon]
MPFFVYLVECRDKSFYCGYTSDLEKRVKTHNEGKGAKYTKRRRPVKLVHFEKFETKSEAMKRELQIKSYSRKIKEGLVFAKI